MDEVGTTRRRNSDRKYWAALERGDRVAALTVVKALQNRGLTSSEIIDDLVVPAQARIGELWLDGTWTVERERAATAVNEGLVHWLWSFAPPPDPHRPVVVVACVEHDRHSLPALVVAEALAREGYRVSYLGGEPDTARLLRTVLGTRPRAVLFSASLTSSLAGQRRTFAEIRSLGIPVIVGGSAFGGRAARADALGATAYAADLAEAVRLLETLPERLRPVEVPPRTPADVEAEWILEQRRTLADGVVSRLLEQVGDGAALPTWWPDLVDHVDHVVGCLAASVATGDDSIVAEVHDWLGRVVEARGGDREVVGRLWALLAVPLRGHPLARIHLASAATPAATPAAPPTAPPAAPVAADGIAS